MNSTPTISRQIWCKDHCSGPCMVVGYKFSMYWVYGKSKPFLKKYLLIQNFKSVASILYFKYFCFCRRNVFNPRIWPKPNRNHFMWPSWRKKPCLSWGHFIMQTMSLMNLSRLNGSTKESWQLQYGKNLNRIEYIFGIRNNHIFCYLISPLMYQNSIIE